MKFFENNTHLVVALFVGGFILFGSESNAQAQTSSANRFTYGTPFSVTVEHATGKTLAQVFSRVTRQLRLAQTSRCPRRSTLITRSFQFNAIPVTDAAGTPASLSLDGNGSFEVQCKTRNATAASS